MRARLRSQLQRVRLHLRDAVADAWYASGISLPRRRAHGSLVIFTFHRVLPPALRDAYPLPELVVTPEELDFILTIAKQFYTAGPLTELIARNDNGERPEKPFLAITFDDGQLDNLEYAAPVLRRHGIPATFFVVTGATENNEALWHDRLAFTYASLGPEGRHAFSGGQSCGVRDLVHAAKDLRPADREALISRLEDQAGGPVRPSWDGIMSWQQLRDLQAEGHEIGVHTRTHPILTLSTESELRDEIETAGEICAANLGSRPATFCYPNGSYDQRVEAVVRRAGYRYATTTQAGVNPPQSNALTMKRYDIQGRHMRRADGSYDARTLLFRQTRTA